MDNYFKRLNKLYKTLPPKKGRCKLHFNKSTYIIEFTFDSIYQHRTYNYVDKNGIKNTLELIAEKYKNYPSQRSNVKFLRKMHKSLRKLILDIKVADRKIKLSKI